VQRCKCRCSGMALVPELWVQGFVRCCWLGSHWVTQHAPDWQGMPVTAQSHQGSGGAADLAGRSRNRSGRDQGQRPCAVVWLPPLWSPRGGGEHAVVSILLSAYCHGKQATCTEAMPAQGVSLQRRVPPFWPWPGKRVVPVGCRPLGLDPWQPATAVRISSALCDGSGCLESMPCGCTAELE
jgi:hypothetical protein